MLNTNCEFLRADVMDAVRLFGCEEEDFTHTLTYKDGAFINTVEYNGSVHSEAEPCLYSGETEYKRYARRYAKLAFYNVLSKAKGVTFPWGALTGIRPTKMAYTEMERGGDYVALFKKLHVIEPNISLIQQVLDGQKDIYKQNRGNGEDLFISLPFCPTKCEYCSFITAPIAATRQYVDAYVDSLIKEIYSLKPLITKLNSVYVGGGTPFVLDCDKLERIYAAINTLGVTCEFTVEAGRPDEFCEEKLKLSKDYGVNRICVNPQSFSDKTLAAIGRKHTTAQTYAAYEMAQKYGFDINVDLIAGLADETPSDFAGSVQRAAELSPANITVHTLSLKSGAKLKENVSRLNVGGIGSMISLSREILADNGYSPYYLYRQKYQAGGNENTGWAKQGKACVYNVDVMEEICSNIAAGANAISKKVYNGGERIERYASPKDIKTYLEKTDEIISRRNALFGL
ncbi:MAG: coproporphyrinogen dehydrogenase HemZ [Clostridia bacterium]|nr:coproporphyrinogen dehydrogenase HemZ [Clostridia bacterium]